MPQTAQKKNSNKALASKLQANAEKSIEKVIISCWEQDYELPEILASLHHYNLDTPVLKSCVEWLLLTEKIAEFNFKPSENQVSEQLEKIKEQVKAESPTEWQQWLEKQQIQETAIIKRIEFQDQLNQLKEAVVTEAALKDVFLQQKTQRDSLVFQVCKFPTIETAQEAWNKLTQEKTDFTNLIFNQTEVQQQGFAGFIGPVACSQINPEVLRRIIRLEPQEYSDPFTVNGTEFMIVRLLNKQLLTPVPTLMEQLKDQVFQKWIAEQLRLAKPHWRFFTGKEWLEASASEETTTNDNDDDETNANSENSLLKSLGFGFLFGKKGGSV
ncbi:MAG: hypothetical protein H2174_03135 [Vampirovibrio sp.]|nr:hypothetical protein [Vampirovibrio sp.]